jgi:subtilisin family serine protease
MTGLPDDENKSYRVRRADPASRRYFSIFDSGHGDYVVPMGLDLAKLDIELFNVDFLISEGYHVMDSLPVIITGTDAAGLANIGAGIEALGGRVTYESKALPVLAAELPLSDVGKIAPELWERVDVNKIWLDQKVSASLDASVPLIGAPQVWDLGFRGDGVEIAVLDTGIDASHPDLNDLDDDPTTNDPKVLQAVDFTGDATTEDLIGHGTHVAGTAAGTGKVSGGNFTGVAPGANLWNVRVLNSSGGGMESWIIEGIEFAALGPDALQRTGDESDIINMSLGVDINGDGTDPLSLATDFAVDQGLVVVVAAGNSGPGMFTVGQLAGARKAVSVGASDDEDLIADFSSRGPTSDFRLKPDIVSPGVDIIAPCAGVIGCAEENPYVSASGTSMATPHVAGAAALIRQAHPDWTPAMVKSALMNHALVLDDGVRIWEQGAGRVQVPDAANTILLAMDPSFEFGELTAGEGDRADLTLRNLSDSQVVVDLSAITTIDGVASGLVSIAPPSLSIPAGAQGTAKLTVGPVGRQLDGWHEGRITATYPQGKLTVPYLVKVHQDSGIAVTPSSFEDTAVSLQLLERTLTIKNTGAGELTYRVRGIEPPAVTVARNAGPERPQEWGGLPDRLAEVRAQSPDQAPDVIAIPESLGLALAPIITDPPGDNTGGPPEADILKVDGDAAGEFLTLQVSFNEHTFMPEVVGIIHLDTDQDPTTGLPTTDLLGTLAQDIGVDFFLDLFGLPDTGEIVVFDADFNFINSVPGEFIGQSLRMSIPLTALGDDDGNMEVTMALGSFSGPTDWAPDAGHGTLDPNAVSWLCFNPFSGAVAPGGSEDVAVSINCLRDLPLGTHTAEIVIENNAPGEGPVIVPLTLLIDEPGSPEVDVTPASLNPVLDTDQVFTTSLNIANIPNAGPDVLSFQITDADLKTGLDAPWLSLSPRSGLVDPGSTQEVVVTFDATDLIEGEYSALISVVNNDPDESPVLVPVTMSVTAPDIGVTPPSLAVTLDRNEIITETLTVTNAGTGTLVFEADLVDTTSPVTGAATGIRWAAPPPEGLRPVPPAARSRYSVIPGGASQGAETRAVAGVELLANDLFAVADNGFIVRVDSDTGEITRLVPPEPISFGPDGLAVSRDFLFFINGFGSNAIYKMTHDGAAVDVFATPADAIFDGLAYNDGVLYGLDFGSGRIFAFDPDSGAVLAEVPAQADVIGGLAPGPDGTLYVSEGLRSVVQIDPATGAVVARIFESSGGFNGLAFDGTLLVLGSPAGNHLMVNPESGEVVGQITGLPGVYALAIPPGGVPWLSVNPVSGVVPPGGSLEMTVTLDATGLEPGTYTADIVISHNDPDEPPVVKPVAVTVLPPAIGVNPKSFAATLDRNKITTDTLTITNAGPGTLAFEIPTVDRLISAEPALGLVAPGSFADVWLTFRATDLNPGTHELGFTIESNDPDEPQISGPVAITVPPPSIEISPKSFAVTLDRNRITADTLTITNAGPGTMVFAIPSVDRRISAEPAQGLIAPGSFGNVLLTFRATDLDPGTHELGFAIESNDPDKPQVAGQVAITVPPPDIGVSPKSFAVTLDRNEMTTDTLTVTNAGPGTLAFEIPSNDRLISVNPARGLISPGSFVNLSLTFRATDLDPGTHEAGFTIESNDPDEDPTMVKATITVPGTLGPTPTAVPTPPAGPTPTAIPVPPPTPIAPSTSFNPDLVGPGLRRQSR